MVLPPGEGIVGFGGEVGEEGEREEEAGCGGEGVMEGEEEFWTGGGVVSVPLVAEVTLCCARKGATQDNIADHRRAER